MERTATCTVLFEPLKYHSAKCDRHARAATQPVAGILGQQRPEKELLLQSLECYIDDLFLQYNALV